MTNQELFLNKERELLTKKEWIEKVKGLRGKVDSQQRITDEEKSAKEIIRTLKKAIKKRVPKNPEEPAIILFSGGVDCTIIAKILLEEHPNTIGITIGFQDEKTKIPEDVEEGERTAKILGLKNNTRIISLQEAEELFLKTAKILSQENLTIVNLGVGSVELAGIRTAKELLANNKEWTGGEKIIFTGLGSEEIFAGYQRHLTTKNLEEECWKGMITTYDRDLKRDYEIAKKEGITFATPFLDEEVITTALRISPELRVMTKEEAKKKSIVKEELTKLDQKNKLPEKIKKYILRVAALKELQLNPEIAFRPKKAAQYGSRIDKAITKIAQKKKLTKKEYLEELKKSD